MGDIEMNSTKNVEIETIKSETENDKHFLTHSRETLVSIVDRHSNVIRRSMTIIIHICIICYITYAVFFWYHQDQTNLDFCNGLGLLLIFAFLFYWSLLYYYTLKPFLSLKLQKCDYGLEYSGCLNKFVVVVPVSLFAVFILYDTYPNPKRLIPLIGIFTFIFGGFVFSKYPAQIQWSIVYRGIGTQLLLAMLTVRWKTGRNILHCVGEKVKQFIAYSYEGSAFVYGDFLVNQQAVFAFQSLSAIFFIGFVVEILFYYKILQNMFVMWGWVLQKLIGTTAIESINCCVSVFLGMSEAPVLIRPYLKDLTKSELQSVMLGSLATVAGTVFAAYVSFGVNPSYLITASIMSAPAALSYSKLLYPETEVSKTKSENIEIRSSNECKSVLSAASQGVFNFIPMVQGIIANVIACISFISFVNGTLSWFGRLVGVENFTLDAILSKFFIPVALIMGVEPAECADVAKLIALKTTINEFVAYRKLGELKKLQKLSPRSEFIATYALCSFANPTSIGVLLAILNSLCPEQNHNTAKLALRAFFGGTITCFITASISALLMNENDIATPGYWNSTQANNFT